jgi:nucleotide-binding universal stress UspA family protein
MPKTTRSRISAKPPVSPREETVVCAVDLSPASQQVLAMGAEMAQAYQARLIVFHALEVWDPRYDFLKPDLEERLGTEARGKVTQELEHLGQAHPVPVEVIIRRGLALEEALNLVQERAPRMLVIARNKSADPAHNELGPMAEELLRLSTAPVLLAGPAKSRDIKRILCAVSGGQPSGEAVRWAVDLARRENIEQITVFHAYQVPIGYLEAGLTFETASDKMLKIHQADLEALLKPFRDGPLRFRTLFEEGPVAQAVAGVAEREQADLLVIGTEIQSYFAALLLGRMTPRIVREARLPVLVVKAEKHRRRLLDVLKRL